jgi:methyl-accepting chemotaxis protein
MRQINAAETFLATDALPSMIIINEINDDANNLREHELNYVIADNLQEIAGEETEALKLRQEIAESVAEYEKRVDNDQERDRFAALKQQLAAYLVQHDKSLAGAKGSLGKEKESSGLDLQARDISGKAFDQLGNRIDDLIALNVQGVKESHQQSTSIYGNALTGMIIISAVSLSLAMLLASLIARGFLRQLGGEPVYAAGIASRIAEGDLTVAIQTKSGDTSSLLYATRSMRDSLVRIVTEVRISTDAVATASSEIAAGNHDLSSRTEEQAASLEETASSMEELTATVKQNADNALQGSQLATSASSIAVRGGEVVSQVVDTMGDINTSSKKIVDIIAVIDGIAFQTNILALNAAVEAARAGEQGRGFAVVATEVRSLAQRSASAAKEIKALITASVEKVDSGTLLVGQAGTTMHEVVESVKRVTDIMREICAASDEQRHGIEQVNVAIIQMDSPAWA